MSADGIAPDLVACWCGAGGRGRTSDERWSGLGYRQGRAPFPGGSARAPEISRAARPAHQPDPAGDAPDGGFGGRDHPAALVWAVFGSVPDAGARARRAALRQGGKLRRLGGFAGPRARGGREAGRPCPGRRGDRQHRAEAAERADRERDGGGRAARGQPGQAEGGQCHADPPQRGNGEPSAWRPVDGQMAAERGAPRPAAPAGRRLQVAALQGHDRAGRGHRPAGAVRPDGSRSRERQRQEGRDRGDRSRRSATISPRSSARSRRRSISRRPRSRSCA